MPIYSYQCEVCQKQEDKYNTIDDRKNGPDCHGSMKLVIGAANIQPILGGGDFPGYMCPVTDTFVSSRKQRKRIMDEHNLIETGDRGETRGRMAGGFKPGEDRGTPD